jgi:hypothetical protein
MRGLAALGLGPIRAWLASERAGSPVPSRLSPAPPPPSAEQPALPADRSAREVAIETLWGMDCAMPGGGDELVRLASVFGPTSASTILLVGAREGSPARRLATEFGTWVAGVESDPYLLDLAARRAGRGGTAAKRASVVPWNPVSPAFRQAFHHHAVVPEALGQAEPAPLATSLAASLKPHGHVVLLDVVADDPIADSALLARWMQVENRRLPPPTEALVTRSLSRAGFDVRVAEDVSARHQKLCMLGWRGLVARIERGRPPPSLAAALVGEAERWLWRMRLMRDGHLRMVRWHAISTLRQPPS